MQLQHKKVILEIKKSGSIWVVFEKYCI